MASPVCRRLQFDDSVNPDTSQNPQNPDRNIPEMPLADIRAERQRAMEKWNFDFENEVPLEGDWVWERVDPVEVVENKVVVAAMKEKKCDNVRNV